MPSCWASVLPTPDVAGSINQLPSWINRTIALAALAAIAAYLIWLLPRPRVIGRDGWTLTLPSARSTLLQIGIGIADLGLAAFAMYVLISAHDPVDVVQAVIAFVFSAMLGFLSGTIALASWVPEGFLGAMFRTVAAPVPPPTGAPSPMAWGTERRRPRCQ